MLRDVTRSFWLPYPAVPPTQPVPIPTPPYIQLPHYKLSYLQLSPNTQLCIPLIIASAHAYFISMDIIWTAWTSLTGSPMLCRCSCFQPPCTLRKLRMWLPRSASNLLSLTSRCNTSSSTLVNAVWLQSVSCSAVAISTLQGPFNSQLPFCNGIFPWCTSVSSILCSHHSRPDDTCTFGSWVHIVASMIRHVT